MVKACLHLVLGAKFFRLRKYLLFKIVKSSFSENKSMERDREKDEDSVYENGQKRKNGS